MLLHLFLSNFHVPIKLWNWSFGSGSCSQVWVRNWSCHAVLEGDSELVMTALVEGVSLASVDLLIKDVVHLSTSFSKLLYSYTRRDENRLAHSLARHAINVDGGCFTTFFLCVSSWFGQTFFGLIKAFKVFFLNHKREFESFSVN